MNVSPEPTEAQPDPNVETQDGLGALDDHTQQVDPDEIVNQGSQPDAEVKTASKATLGRHVKHEAGVKSAERRKAHVKSVRKQREKENFGKK